jgi:predicted metal-dependent peptidase
MLAVATNLTAEQRLNKAVITIMGHPEYVAIAGVLMVGDREVREDIPTACTNGRDEYYGREFVDSLSDAQLRFVVLHECYHKMYKHLTTWKHLSDKCALTANKACDYVINIQILDRHKHDKFVEGIEGMCYDTKYRDWATPKVFDDIYQQQQQDGNSGGNESGDGDGQPSHSSQQPFDEHDWDGAQEMTEEEKEVLGKEIDEAIRQGAITAGKMGSGGERTVAELLEPQVDWREVLREFITTHCNGSDYATYNRPNRRLLHTGVYFPSGISEQVEELVVNIDTSGSITNHVISLFLSEVKCVCDTVKPKKLRVLYWDTEVCRAEEYEMHELDTLTQSTKPAGGGGTDVNCVTSYMDKHNIKPQAAIILTDGYLYNGWGSWSCPTLWCILDNKGATADCGKTIHINSGDML